MTLGKKLRHDLLTLTPLYAAVGATDLAARKLRELGAEDRPAGDEAPTGPRAELTGLVRGARAVPGFALGQAVGAVSRTQEAYEGLATRGRDLARRTEADRAERDDALGRGLARSREAEGVARSALARTRTALDRTSATARSEAGEVVEAVRLPGRDRGARDLRDAATQVEQSEQPRAPRRRRTRAAARTAAPGTGAPSATEDEAPVVRSVPAGSGVEAGSTVTAAVRTGGPAEAAAPPAGRRRAPRTRKTAAVTGAPVVAEAAADEAEATTPPRAPRTRKAAPAEGTDTD